MSKNVIYLIGIAIIGGVKGYYPDLFRNPIAFVSGVVYLMLLSFVAHKFGK
jgi:hypothetical protein